MRIDALFAHAANLGLAVEWADLGDKRRGAYYDDERRIALNDRLTQAEAVATLAHELGHAAYGDRCSMAWTERRAWRYGAALAISPGEYVRAERIVGSHPNAVAAELEVTPRLVMAWRDWYAKAGSIEDPAVPASRRSVRSQPACGACRRACSHGS